MKRSFVLLVTAFLLIISSLYSQTLNDYVSAVRGDTLVIKDYSEMNNTPNSLYYALLLDTVNVPEGRVYMLKTNGFYPLATNPTTSASRAVTIVGEDKTILVNNKNANSAPPVISGGQINGFPVSNSGQITVSKALTVKNCDIINSGPDGNVGWSFFSIAADNAKLTVDNCIMEHVRWAFINIRNKNCDVTLKNSYFVNMNGWACKRNGGVLDVFDKQDSLLVENCTHLIAQGSMYKLREFPFNRVIFNHNTFINCDGMVFMSRGYQSNMSLTNNLFVNANVQPYPAKYTIEYDEQDPDLLPMGLVNVYPDSADEANNTPRKFYVDGNAVYWDPSLSDVVSIVDSLKVNGITNWQSQMIKMNSRTQALFNDNLKYPLLTEGVWYNEMPNFTDPKDLFTTQLANLKECTIKIVDTNSSNRLPVWRLVKTGPDDFVHSDWPIPVDLSYNNPTLLSGATGGFPVGDLNWFPVKKAEWNAQRTAEYAAIDNALNTGVRMIVSVDDNTGIAKEFKLGQNYPNPFNPTTKIEFQIANSGHVSLKIYDILGREVAALVNGFKKAGTYNVEFNASDLPSGVYVYKLQSENNTISKKMVLMK